MSHDDYVDTGASDEASDGTARIGRRALLAGGAALFGSGCVQQSQSLVDRSTPEQVSLTIKTVPADADAKATTIARYLSERLNAVGIDARLTLMSREELYRDILLNQKFDLYVTKYPHVTDPDFLRPLLHSRFGGDVGWKNPFGYTNLQLDEKLAAQRTQTGERRAETLRSIERTVARDQPFTVVAFPEEIRAVRSSSVTGLALDSKHTALRYLAVDPTRARERTESDGADRLNVTISDSRPTENLNPLAVEFRNLNTVTDLLYDSVGRWVNGRVRPWIASDWEWDDASGSERPQAVVTLRDDLQWHDGTPLTAADVTFSYRFLRDTSLGKAGNPAPAPNYRGETSLVDSVWMQSDDRLVVQFNPVSRQVATRAFTVPVLPEHEWAKRSQQATIAGVQTGGAVTQALVWNNMRPVGSGPLQFVQAKTKESLLLERFDDHFLTESSVDGELGAYEGGFPFEELGFVVVPSNQAAVKLVAQGTADFTGSPLSQSDVSRIGRSENLTLRVSRPNSFYHVGYNARTAPNSNARFRRAVAHLLDKAFIVDKFFGGYATPAASPLARGLSSAPELAWNGTDPETPFPGENGRLNLERARDIFRDAGYQYTDQGTLVQH